MIIGLPTPRIALWGTPARAAAALWRVSLAREACCPAECIALPASLGELAMSLTQGGADGLLEVVFRDDRDLEMLAEALDRLDASGAALSLRLRRYGQHPAPPSGLALVGEVGTRMAIQRWLEEALRARPHLVWRLDSLRPPLVLPPDVSEVRLRTRAAAPAPVADIAGRNLKVVAAFGAEKALAGRALSRQMLRVLLAEGLPELLAVTDAGGVEPLAAYPGAEARTLFVFPERLLPVSRAFYSRGFDLLCALNAAGVPTDVLAFGPPQEAERRRIEAALRAVAPRATVVPLRRASRRPAGLLVWRLERVLRRIVREAAPAPMRFSERQDFFGSRWQSAQITQAVTEGGYSRVIMTGAWSLRTIAALRRSRPDLRIACDTHDVFFVADTQANARLRRFLYSPARQKSREMAALQDCDLVIAISHSDADNLRQAGLAAPLLVESGTFEYARVDPAISPDAASFGYIGTANSHNRLALETLRREWWPAILRAFPAARLRIAGAACRTPEAEQMAASHPAQVELAGFVRDLRDFYAGVRTMLSPISIQGGLNFKSVEALVAGRELLITELGARCIGGGTGLWVADGAEALATAIARIAATSHGQERRAMIQTEALAVFGEAAGFRGLAAWAAGEAQLGPAADPASTRAVLQQAAHGMLRDIQAPGEMAAPLPLADGGSSHEGRN
jgi:hypothetical protein